MSSNNEVELIATAGFGLEAVVARELKGLGYERQSVADGRVTFLADLNAICRTNLWLRSADRVLLKLGSFEARDFGELFDRTAALDWARWIPSDGQFPVRGKSVRSQLHSVRDCQAIVKKAIVEKLKQTHRDRLVCRAGTAVCRRSLDSQGLRHPHASTPRGPVCTSADTAPSWDPLRSRRPWPPHSFN